MSYSQAVIEHSGDTKAAREQVWLHRHKTHAVTQNIPLIRAPYLVERSAVKNLLTRGPACSFHTGPYI